MSAAASGESAAASASQCEHTWAPLPELPAIPAVADHSAPGAHQGASAADAGRALGDKGPAPGQPGGCTLLRKEAGPTLRDECVCGYRVFAHPAGSSSDSPATVAKPCANDPISFRAVPLSGPGKDAGGPSVVERLQKVKLRGYTDKRLDDLDPMHHFSADTRLREALRGSHVIGHPRVGATGAAYALLQLLADLAARKLAHAIGVLRDPAMASVVRTLPEIPLSGLCPDWSQSTEKIGLLDLVESAACDVMELVASITDFEHSVLASEAVYHGRLTGVYRFVEARGSLMRGSWLYAKIRESNIARLQVALHRAVASPRRSLTDAVTEEPVIQFAVASMLADQPALMNWYAAKHNRITELQKAATSEQKPFLPRWNRENPERKRKFPALTGAFAGEGEGERGPGVDGGTDAKSGANGGGGRNGGGGKGNRKGGRGGGRG